MRDHTKLFILSKRPGYSRGHGISGCESSVVEAEKVLDALIQSMHKS